MTSNCISHIIQLEPYHTSSTVEKVEVGELVSMIVDFTKLELNKLIPIYIQIIRHVKMEIVAGKALDGYEMPSRRVLSTLISVNPNTVQKAYRQMEEEGILLSYPGSKSVVVVNEEVTSKIRQELISDEVLSFINSAKSMGFDLDQAKGVLDRYWAYEDEEVE